MTEPEPCKRITFKRTRPNPLFQEWLEELYEEATVKNSKLELMLKIALESLSKYPLPLQSGAECSILEGFNKKLCLFLDQRLEVFRENNKLASTLQPIKYRTSGDKKPTQVSVSITTPNNSNAVPAKNDYNLPLTSQCIIKNHSASNNESETANTYKSDTNVVHKPPKRCKEYKPAFRSGGYAILVALLENMKENPSKSSLMKEVLIDKAQKHSEESFIRPRPDSFYTAWSNMSRLITKGLVYKVGNRKAEYSLTNKGVLLTTEILKEAKSNPTTNDIIFNSEHSTIPSNLITSNNNTLTENYLSHGIKSRTDDNFQAGSNNSYEEMAAGSFDIILLIDKNETGGLTKKNDPTVAQFNKYPDLKHEYRSLKVGDFTWVARSKQNEELEFVLPYVVERKRMDDLGHSIKDGRFHEQKFRLRRCGIKNVIYLVESFGSNKHVGLPIQSLMQALANTRVHDGFKIHMTDSLTNSARFLAMMTKRVTIEYKEKNLQSCSSEPKGEELMMFANFNRASAKSKTLTVTETFIKILLQLKGVSVEKALAITKQYPTPKALISIYKTCDQKEGEFLLANLKHGELGRNVGPSVSKSIYQLFFNKELM